MRLSGFVIGPTKYVQRWSPLRTVLASISLVGQNRSRSFGPLSRFRGPGLFRLNDDEGKARLVFAHSTEITNVAFYDPPREMGGSSPRRIRTASRGTNCEMQTVISGSCSTSEWMAKSI